VFCVAARISSPALKRPKGGSSPVSSAILYVAIVAIWACVLIPRWLRRDSAHGAVHAPGDTAPDDSAHHVVVPGDTAPDDAARPAAVSPEDVPAAVVADDRPANPLPVPDRATVPSEAPDCRRNTAADSPEQDTPPQPLTAEESRRRMLSARRRLLGMLLALEVAAISLAVLELAALWVVIPPSVMLAGYLLLLREAAHADAERAERERDAASRTQARARGRAQARARAARSGAAPAGAGDWAVAAGPAAPAAQYEDGGPGRDFAPGLAGKYTTSNAHVIDIGGRADEDVQHEPTEQQLRAVGD
jgi:hypothetical protein